MIVVYLQGKDMKVFVEVEAEDLKAVYDELEKYQPNANFDLAEAKRWASIRFMDKLKDKMLEKEHQIEDNLRQMLGLHQISRP